jgi:KUP system potassium uptake protein
VTSTATESTDVPAEGLGALALGALGVVYGDLGTSPLYTVKTAVAWSGGRLAPDAALGMLSLMVWSLVIVTSIKYVAVIMRADNDGEGGILALMSLLGLKAGRRPVIIAMGMLGAALLFGDGAITPAISVLSALEGLESVAAPIKPLIVPLSLAVLVALFALQPRGTARISRLFGPIMLAWFVVIGLTGIAGILRHPQVLWALNPLVGLKFLAGHGSEGFLLLGAVFLCVTGAEALYADMGHFGAKPIRLAWYALVFPALVLNYAGQIALLIASGGAETMPFFALCPKMLQMPMVALATAATVIASQAIISGAFSMTRQAIQLGLLPRLRISQTSRRHYGQIYVGVVNWSLMVVTLLLTATFRSSDALASAFGVAVSLTMLLTSLLLFVAMREVWRWSLFASIAVAGLFILVDTGFVAANCVKFFEGGWIPIVVAALLFFLMTCWNDGHEAMCAALARDTCPLPEFIEKFRRETRTPGTAVYLTSRDDAAPMALISNVKLNNAIHERIVLLDVVTERVPRVDHARRLRLTELSDGFHTVCAHYGFMEHPNIPRALTDEQSARPLGIDLAKTSFFIGRLVVAPRGHSWWWRTKMHVFNFLHRTALPITEFFRIPAGRVVELSSESEC